MSLWKPGQKFAGSCRATLVTPNATNVATRVKQLSFDLSQVEGALDVVKEYVVEFNDEMTEASGHFIISDGHRGEFKLRKEEAGENP